MPGKKKNQKLSAQKLQKRDTPRMTSIDPEPAPGGSGKSDPRGR
jgi:hypothetical protein